MISLCKISAIVVLVSVSVICFCVLTQAQFVRNDDDETLGRLQWEEGELNPLAIEQMGDRLSELGAFDQYAQSPQNGLPERLVEQLLLAGQLTAGKRQQEQTDFSNNQQQYSDLAAAATKRLVPANGYLYYDINSHLPAETAVNGRFNEDDRISENTADLISKPVNNPEDFEERLGEMTNQLNYGMANTLDRQQLLMELMNNSMDLNSEFKITSQQQQADGLLSDNMDANGSKRLINELGSLLAGETRNSDEQQLEQAGDNNRNSITDLKSSAPTDSGRYGASEYIDHPLALLEPQLVQGGAGEGNQHLGPDGSFPNVQVIKTDTGVPSYCNPPNPCPIGYTAKDGCLENFVNSASFSREYQAQQKCSCDNEHSLFHCKAPSKDKFNSASSSSGVGQSLLGRQVDMNTDRHLDEGSLVEGVLPTNDKLDTLARTVHNRYGDLASIQKLISSQQQRQEDDLGTAMSASFGEDSNYLVRSARKFSSPDMQDKVVLD